MASVAANYPSPNLRGDGTAALVGGFNRMNLNSLSSTIPHRYSTPNATSATLCVVCQLKPRYNRNRRSYPTCGLACASRLTDGGLSRQPALQRSPSTATFASVRRGQAQSATGSTPSPIQISSHPSASPIQPGKPACVVCKTRSACRNYVTCGLSCKEKLCTGGGDPTMCDYCYKAPRSPGLGQCSDDCLALSQEACLLCKCRPRNGFYHLCGNACKEMLKKMGVVILEVAKGHSTFNLVESRFRKAWKSSGTVPRIRKVYKVIESDDMRKPYENYRNTVGNEQFRYHGTTKTCQIGASTTDLCTSSTCAACNILRTSFKVSIGNAGGAFGQGVYTSSASNKSYSYTVNGLGGVILLNKVALGKTYQVNEFAAVRGCPPGYNSVVFNRNGGALNETVVYRDDAIRPVFLIVF